VRRWRSAASEDQAEHADDDEQTDQENDAGGAEQKLDHVGTPGGELQAA
jgi:hypothetical protein